MCETETPCDERWGRAVSDPARPPVPPTQPPQPFQLSWREFTALQSKVAGHVPTDLPGCCSSRRVPPRGAPEEAVQGAAGQLQPIWTEAGGQRLHAHTGGAGPDAAADHRRGELCVCVCVCVCVCLNVCVDCFGGVGSVGFAPQNG